MARCQRWRRGRPPMKSPSGSKEPMTSRKVATYQSLMRHDGGKSFMQYGFGGQRRSRSVIVLSVSTREWRQRSHGTCPHRWRPGRAGNGGAARRLGAGTSSPRARHRRTLQPGGVLVPMVGELARTRRLDDLRRVRELLALEYHFAHLAQPADGARAEYPLINGGSPRRSPPNGRSGWTRRGWSATCHWSSSARTRAPRSSRCSAPRRRPSRC